MSILSATLVISGLCLLAIILDTTQRDPGGAHWLAEVAMVMGVARATRLVWLFGKVIAGGATSISRMSHQLRGGRRRQAAAGSVRGAVAEPLRVGRAIRCGRVRFPFLSRCDRPLCLRRDPVGPH
jgi:hypothetical protein